MKILWKPQKRQSEALERAEREILYGGARGGGKTDAGMAWLLYDKDASKYRALVIRKNATDLGDWIDRAESMFSSSKGTKVGTKFGTEFQFPSGAKIRTGHLADKDAYTKYQGHEYQKMVIEELSQIPREKDYLKLLASNRSTVDGIHPQIFSTTNPDDPGIDWIRERWGIPEVPDFKQIYKTEKVVEIADDEGNLVKRKRTLVFVPAKLEDNPILIKKDPDYMIQLELLKQVDYELYDAWRNGNWKGYGVEGAYYRNQMIKMEKEGRITDVPYDELLPVYTWNDLGIRDSFCIGYFQNYGKKWSLIDYDEFEGEGLIDVAKRMSDKGYFYKGHYAPHDIKVRELGTGKSRLEVAEGLGINYEVCANLGVADGINAVRMRLSTLWVDKTKGELFLKRIRRYHKEFDEIRGVFKDKPVHDINSHAADMLRGWAITDDIESKTSTSYTPEWVTGR